jgi:RNA polymerase sigma-70 factor, ECF subfamily
MLSSKDARMLKQLLNKDERALQEFYSEHKEALMQFLQRQLDVHDAEEVLQDAFFGFIEGLRNFREQSTLKTFLYSIAKRKAIDKLRRKKVKKILFSYFPDHVVDSLATVFMKDNIDKKFLEHRINKVLAKLPNDYALVLRLKYKEGYKVAEIAEEINMSFKATESLLFRARQSFIHTYTAYERQNIPTIKEAL